MPELVYGEVSNGLVFIEPGKARELAALRDALETATTWADLRAAVNPERWAEIERRVTGGETEMPALSEPIEETPPDWRGEGEWPEWPAQEMLDWIPHAVEFRFGRVEDTLITGSYLHLDPGDEDEIVAALEEAGWRCHADELLVAEASGYRY